MTSKAKNQQVCQDEACHLGEGGGEGGGDEQHQGGHGRSNQVALHGRHKIAPRLTFPTASSKLTKTVKWRLQTIETNAFYIM